MSASILADVGPTSGQSDVREAPMLGTDKATERGSWTASALDLPNLNTRSAYAVSSKIAGRINATTITPQEQEALLMERQLLLDRMFAGEISPRDENRLAYVRWSLDRIEDARHGFAFDALENQVEMYEGFLSEIEKFRSQLEAKAPKKNRR